jgi:polyhydroxybutyrate depolymerase
VGVGGRAGGSRPRWRWAAVVLGCALALVAGCTPDVSGLSGLPPGSPDESTTTTVHLADRTALLYLPAKSPAGVPASLVVALHGYTADAAGVVDFLGLRPLADSRGFLVLAPQGTTDREGHTFWNAARACCNFAGSTVDDSEFLSRLIAGVTSAYGIGSTRVYLVGHSNGGFMAHRFACDHPDQVGAIASIAGALDVDATCEPAKPVSVLQVHGDADETIAYDGGEISGRSYTSADQTVARWRQIDGCRTESHPATRLDADADVKGDDLKPTSWTDCGAGTRVALWTIAGGRHNPTLTPAFTTALYDWFEAGGRR